jgi:hypothetical protein
MYEMSIKQGLMISTFIISGVTISKLNPAVSDFFLSPFVIFLTITLYLYEKNKNILLSMATAFFFSVFVAVVTMEEPVVKLKESFGIIYPNSNTHAGCVDIKISDLLAAFGGDETKLKTAMQQSSVPYNLTLTDVNSPEIATYLINNGKIEKIGDKCKI